MLARVSLAAEHAAQLRAPDIMLASDASTSMQSHGSIALTSSETSGSVDVVAQSLTTRTTQVSLSGSDDVAVQSSGGTLMLSSSSTATDKGSVVLSATNSEGVVNVEAGSRLDANAASTRVGNISKLHRQ